MYRCEDDIFQPAPGAPGEYEKERGRGRREQLHFMRGGLQLLHQVRKAGFQFSSLGRIGWSSTFFTRQDRLGLQFILQVQKAGFQLLHQVTRAGLQLLSLCRIGWSSASTPAFLTRLG
jgi:hypothetical protein